MRTRTTAGQTGTTAKTLPWSLEARAAAAVVVVAAAAAIVAAAVVAVVAAAWVAAVSTMTTTTTKHPGGRESPTAIGRPVHPRLPRPRRRRDLSGDGVEPVRPEIETFRGGRRLIGGTPFFLVLPRGLIHHRWGLL